MNSTTAEYSLNGDGTIRIENVGFNYLANKWEEAVGKAKFTGSSSIGN